jgi:hypothetical protein
MPVLTEFLRRATNLNMSRGGGVTKPYKPSMLLAAILLLRKGSFADNLITLGELTPVFTQVMKLLAPGSRMPSDMALPFKHLETDRVWHLVPDIGADPDALRALMPSDKARAWVKRSLGCRMEPEVFAALTGDGVAAVETAELVFETHLAVFRQNGLTDPQRARMTLRGWLGAEGLESTFVGEPAPRRTLLERCVEDWFESQWLTTPFGLRGLRLANPGRQVLTPINTIDLLAHDAIEQLWWVIEIKRGNSSDAVVGQLARYRGWIEQDKQQRSRGIILTDEVSAKLHYAVQSQSGVELWRYNKAFELERAL